MAPMLGELLRWRRTAAAVAVGGRWRAWARALAARRARLDARAGGPAMTLVAPRGSVTRWTRSVVALQPHVRLSLGLAPAGAPAAVNGTGSRGAPRAIAAARPVARAPDAVPGAPALTLVRPASPAQRRPPGAASSSRPPVIVAQLRPPDAASPRPAMLVARRPPTGAAPRTREMLVATGGPTAEHRRAAPALVGARLTVARIVESRRRVEEPRGLPLPERVRASAPPLPGDSSDASRPAHPDAAGGWMASRPPAVVPAPRAAAATASPPAPPAPAPAADRAVAERRAVAPLDLESITDQVVRQIDRRIVAHRERMGRI